MKKAKNWWYYYKWYVILGAILLSIIIYIAGNALGLWKKAPDFQIAYVGSAPLPEDTVNALEQAFAELGSDFNGDGSVIVHVNQYIDSGSKVSSDLTYEYGSEITLIADITNCDSYFFIVEDPEDFQRSWQILAMPDGSCPGDTDYSVEGKVFQWSQSPVLSQLPLGTYSSNTLGIENSGNSQDLLSGLYVGRRCFYTDTQTPNIDQCSQLWASIIPNSF